MEGSVEARRQGDVTRTSVGVSDGDRTENSTGSWKVVLHPTVSSQKDSHLDQHATGRRLDVSRIRTITQILKQSRI